MSVTVEAEDGDTVLFGTPVSDMQEDVVVTKNAITGTLKFIEGGLAQSGPLAGDGNFLALKFSNIDPKATSVKVGLDPSAGTGLVEIINDPDKNGVFKIRDNEQKFVVEITTPEQVERTEYSLADLVLETE